MRPKFQHENSYACLLAEVLEEEQEAEEKGSIRGEKLASIGADLAARPKQPRRRIGAATSTSSSTPRNWLLSPLALLREALVAPLSSSFSWSSSLLARDAALLSYAALAVLAATKALRGRTAAERGFPLLALLVARCAVLAARAAEVRSLVATSAAAAAAAASTSSSSSSSLSPGVASLRSALRWYAGAEAASFVGGLVNVLRVPERWAKPLPPRTFPTPTKTTATAATAETETETAATTEKLPPPPRFRLVDFALNSHSLMHVFSLVALACYHAAAAEDRRHWLEHGCGTG